MYKSKGIAVVMPSYNEELLIKKAVENVPEFVDRIIIVNDMSTDRTEEVAKQLARKSSRITLISHRVNKGVGATIISGYRKSNELGMDYAVIMAGDAQMSPDDLPRLLDTIIDNKLDYVKGNRLLVNDVRKNMPAVRFFGNALLTILNKIATGYWHIMDPQCGYTVISRETIDLLPLDRIYSRYGYPNDMLVKLNVFNCRVRDVPIKAVYGSEKSGIKLHRFMPRVSWLLMRGFFYRLKEKYFVRDFHPVFLFYIMGFIFMLLALFLAGLVFYVSIIINLVPSTVTTVLTAVSFISGLQFLMFGLLFDMEYNKALQ